MNTAEKRRCETMIIQIFDDALAGVSDPEDRLIEPPGHLVQRLDKLNEAVVKAGFNIGSQYMGGTHGYQPVIETRNEQPTQAEKDTVNDRRNKFQKARKAHTELVWTDGYEDFATAITNVRVQVAAFIAEA